MGLFDHLDTTHATLRSYATPIKTSKKNREKGVKTPEGTYVVQILKTPLRGEITAENKDRPFVKVISKVLHVIKPGDNGATVAVGTELEDAYFDGGDNKRFLFRELKQITAAAEKMGAKEANEALTPDAMNDYWGASAAEGTVVKLWVADRISKKGSPYTQVNYYPISDEDVIDALGQEKFDALTAVKV